MLQCRWAQHVVYVNHMHSESHTHSHNNNNNNNNNNNRKQHNNTQQQHNNTTTTPTTPTHNNNNAYLHVKKLCDIAEAVVGVFLCKLGPDSSKLSTDNLTLLGPSPSAPNFFDKLFETKRH